MSALGNAQGSNGLGGFSGGNVALSSSGGQGANGTNLSQISITAVDSARLTFIHFEGHAGSAGGFIPLSPDGGARS